MIIRSASFCKLAYIAEFKGYSYYMQRPDPPMTTSHASLSRVQHFFSMCYMFFWLHLSAQGLSTFSKEINKSLTHKASIRNYRSISSLSCTSKVLERVIYNKIIDFITETVISKYQIWLPQQPFIALLTPHFSKLDLQWTMHPLMLFTLTLRKCLTQCLTLSYCLNYGLQTSLVTSDCGFEPIAPSVHSLSLSMVSITPLFLLSLEFNKAAASLGLFSSSFH